MLNHHSLPKPLWLLVAAILFSVCLNAQTAPPQSATYNQKLQSSSLLFMENKGQVADAKGNLRPDVLFTANSAGAKLYLSANSIHYQFTKTEYPKGYDLHKREPTNDLIKEAELQKQIKTSTHRFSLELQGANLHPTVITEKQSAYTENYYLTHCPDGITGVHGYEKITYKNVYPSIDWVIYSQGGFMEYDFLVHPGGDAEQIQLKVKDAESVSITAAGELVMKTSLGEVTEKAPVSYADGAIVESHFKQLGDNTIGFDVQSQPTKELRIDPAIIWSTYYGGSERDEAEYCTVDGSNNVYLAGTAASVSGIASGGFQNVYAGGSDAFLVKFGANGNRLWATYYGGGGIEDGSSCAVDVNGNVFLAGGTTSPSGIASGGFQDFLAGSYDFFLVKFNSSGSRIWGTYYGGPGADNGSSCAVDTEGNAYVMGITFSTSGVASGGFQNTHGGNRDALLVKFNSNGNRLWATYYGGADYEFGGSCTVDARNNLYLTGYTFSNAGIASNGYQNTFGGGNDVYMVKFRPNGTRVWATYYGGSGNDYEGACVIDNSGNIILSGYTSYSYDLAYNGFQSSYAGGSLDAFLVKFDSSGNRLWATYYGGSAVDYGYSCSVDATGNIYLAGTTSSTSNIASGGFQDTYGGGTNGTIGESFLVKFNSAGGRLWATYFGGSGIDNGNSCAVDQAGNVYFAGSTGSTTAIASGGFQNVYGGGFYDAFLAKINGSDIILPVIITSVNAYQQANNIQVAWAVRQESNIKSYEIEKSLNGTTFTKAGAIAASGTNNYQWLDLNAVNGNNFYRLRIISVDGTIKYSQIVKVAIGNAKAGFEIYPNPITGNNVNLSFINQPKGIYTIRLYNGSSQIILTQKLQHNGGSSAVSIGLSNISKGNYLLQVITPDDKKHPFKIVF